MGRARGLGRKLLFSREKNKSKEVKTQSRVWEKSIVKEASIYREVRGGAPRPIIKRKTRLGGGENEEVKVLL